MANLLDNIIWRRRYDQITVEPSQPQEARINHPYFDVDRETYDNKAEVPSPVGKLAFIDPSRLSTLRNNANSSAYSDQNGWLNVSHGSQNKFQGRFSTDWWSGEFDAEVCPKAPDPSDEGSSDEPSDGVDTGSSD